MAMKCLLYLQVEDVAGYDDNLVSDESDQSSDGDTWYKDLPGPRETQPPFSRYAALQWFEHALIAEQDAAFCDRLVRYLSEAETHLYGLLTVLYESAIQEHWTEAWANSSLIHPLSCFGLVKILSLHLRRLKSAGPDYAYRRLLDASDGEGTALAIAAQFGRVSVVELLLSLGADVCYKKMLGTTALHYVATEGHLDVIEVLLRHPQTDPNVTDQLGRTALGNAAVRSHLPIVQRLAAVTKSAVFAKPSTRVYFFPGPKEGREWQMDTPLGLASNPEVMKVLLERGLPCDIQETAGEDSMLHLMSPLYSFYSSTHASSEKLDLLLASGKFDTNLRGGRGETPLHRAVANRQYHVVERLLRCNDIDITLSNDKGDTPLSLALRLDDQTMLEIFRDSGMVDPSCLCPDRPLLTTEE